MAPYLNVFGFNLQTYPLLLLLAIWAGLWLAARAARRRGLDGDHIYNLGLYALLATLLGARLAYVMSNWLAYRDSLTDVLSLTVTAFAWPQGVAFGSIAGLVYWNRNGLPFWDTVDALTPGVALALAIVRLGVFLDGTGYGEPTTLPWGIDLWDETRHPIQLYEATALLAILAVLHWRRDRVPVKGYTAVLFVVLYAGARLFLEAFRADAPLTAGGVRLVQPVALVTLLGGVVYLYYRRFSSRRA